MRKVLIVLATAGTAFAMAAPAGAQYAPQPRPYDYGQGYGQGYAHQNFGQVRALQARVDRLQRRIERLDRRDALRERLARRLRDETRELERRLRVAARNGLNPYEANGIERRVVQLESRVRSALGRRYDRDEDYGYGRRDGYDGQHAYYGDDNRERGRDRDQDGRGRDRDDD